MKSLTVKQRRFIDVYIETGNAAEAARRAGQPPGATGTAVNKRHGGSATPKNIRIKLIFSGWEVGNGGLIE